MEFQRSVLLVLQIILCYGYDYLSWSRNVTQSSMWDCSSAIVCSNYSQYNAVDEDTNGTCMRTKRIDPYSIYKTLWWKVDISSIASVYGVRIIFKDYGPEYEMRQRGRFAGFSLYLSNSSNIEDNLEDGYLCYKDGPELPPLEVFITCIRHARYFLFYNERLPGVQYPAGYDLKPVTELCDVLLLGCDSGRYGKDCNLTCPSNCQEQRCHIINGTCLGCPAGWTGDFCNETCSYGYYGIGCAFECRGHCRDGISCNRTNGTCDDGCMDGWIGTYCDQECEDGSYGPNCVHTCSDNCLNNTTCNKTTGKCQSCKTGYTGDLCNNINCVNQSYDGVRGACTFGCVPGWIGKNCSEGCDDQWYGQNCSMRCNRECVNQSCDHVNGDCTFGCTLGWTGKDCSQGCDDQWYGQSCSIQCNRECVNQSCDHVNGDCTFGCTPGWTGKYCSQACDKGFYGPNCSETCSKFCKVDKDCNHVDGNCIDGCKIGYNGSKCDRICDDQWYGENCSMRCSPKCLNQSCDHEHGECTFGCTPGRIGKNCSEDCLDGFYGQNCSHNCSSCLDDKCDPVTGICGNGCDYGYTGQQCDKPTPVAQLFCSSSNDAQYGYIAGLSASIIANIFLCGIFIKIRRQSMK